MKKDFYKNKKGFTIIETLVAVAIIMIVIAGPLAASYKGLATAQISRDQLIAAYLAQDAMEYVHYVRDVNLLAGNTFDKDLWNVCATPNSCVVNTTDDSISSAISLANASNDCIYVDGSSGLYVQKNGSGGCTGSGTDKTNFTRRFTVNRISSQEDTVTVTVSWVNGKTTDSFQLVNNILDR